MKRFAVTACALLLAVSAQAGSIEPARFPFTKKLKPPEQLRGKIGSFELDDELLEAASLVYANLRIVDAAGQEVPFLVRDKTETTTVTREFRRTATTVSLKTLPDNRIELIVRCEDLHRTPAAVVLGTRQRDYEKTVSVYGSNDQGKWHMLGDPGPIFDYSKYVDLRNNRIDALGPPHPPYKYYKLEIANISESHQSPLVRLITETRGGEAAKEIRHTASKRKDFKIEKIVFIEKTTREEPGKTVTRQYRVSDLEASEDKDEKMTVITFRTVRAPIRKLKLLTDSANFSRAVTVEVRDGDDDSAQWRKIESATISKIDLPSVHRADTEIPLRGHPRHTDYRLTIHNLDSPPINVTGVEAEGDVREILFLTKPDEQYRAVYGGNYFDSPSYDIASVVRNMVAADTDVYQAGAQEDNPDFGGATPRPLLSGHTLLIVAVLAMVLALTWLIARAAKGIDSAT